MQYITTCDQLLAVAAKLDGRLQLARVAHVSPQGLMELVCRADLARVRGTGFVFNQMLMEVGVTDVASLAEREPITLHEQLQHHNGVTGLSRRSPTAAEVSDWIEQARRLPQLITYGPMRSSPRSKRSHSWDAH